MRRSAATSARPPCISLYLPTSPYTSLYLPVSPYISLYLPISPWVQTGAMMRCDEGRVLVQEYVGLGLG